MTREFVCIVCPNGCSLTATLNGEEIIDIQGGLCARGKAYVEGELTNPKRTVSSSVRVVNGELPLVSVRLDDAIPKKDIFRFMEEIKRIRVEAPVAIGQVIIRDLWGSGVNVIATKDIQRVDRGGAPS